MKTLWLFCNTPGQENRAYISRMLNTGDAVVCIQDGVYLLKGPGPEISVPVYGLEADLAARGITTSAQKLTYPGLVDLIMKYQRVVTI